MRKFPLRCFADGGWRPDLDWLLRPDSVLSILEGKYDWDKQPTASKDDLFGSLRRFAKEQQKPTGRFTGFEIEKVARDLSSSITESLNEPTNPVPEAVCLPDLFSHSVQGDQSRPSTVLTLRLVGPYLR